MAISLVKEWAGETLFVDTVDITVPSGGVAAGSHLILGITMPFSATTVSTVTDDASNSYTVHANLSSGSASLSMASGYLATGLTAGQKIHFTPSVGGQGGSWAVANFSGLVAASYFDKTAQFTTAFSTSWTSGNTATTTQADELIYGCVFGDTTLAYTPGGTFSQIHQEVFTSARNFTEYKTVSSTAAYAADGTVAANTATLAIVGTFKADTGAAAGNIAWVVA